MKIKVGDIGSTLAAVYLDGKKLDLCVSADTGAGEAVCYDNSHKPKDNEDWQKVVFKGKVEIRFQNIVPGSDIHDFLTRRYGAENCIFEDTNGS